MAKSAAQKAEAAVAKATANPTPANVKAAAAAVAKSEAVAANPTASNKEIRQAGNAAKSEVNDAIKTLTNNQALEVKLLKQEGLKSAVAGEKASNTAEVNNLLTGLLSNNFSVPETMSLATSATNYNNQNVANRLGAVSDLRSSLAITPQSGGGEFTSGISDIRLDRALTREYDPTTNSFTGNNPVVKTLNTAYDLRDAVAAGTPLTPQFIAQTAIDNGVNQRLDKLTNRIEDKGFINIGDRSGANQNYTTMMFRPNEAGSYDPSGITKTRIEAPDSNSIFGGLAPVAQLASLLPGMQWLAPYAWGMNTIEAVNSGNPLSIGLSILGGANMLGTDFAGAASAYAQAGYSPSQIADFLTQSGVNSVTANTLAYTASASNAIGGAINGVTDLVKGGTQPSGWDFGPGNMTADQVANLSGTPALSMDQVNAFTQAPAAAQYPVGLNPDEWNLANGDFSTPVQVTDPLNKGLIPAGTADVYTPPTDGYSGTFPGTPSVPGAPQAPGAPKTIYERLTEGVDKAVNYALNNPMQTAGMVLTGASLLNAADGNSLLGGGDTDSGGKYKPTPVDPTIVEKYGNVPGMGSGSVNPGDQSFRGFGDRGRWNFYNLDTPEGLLEMRLQRMRGGLL